MAPCTIASRTRHHSGSSRSSTSSGIRGSKVMIPEEEGDRAVGVRTRSASVSSVSSADSSASDSSVVSSASGGSHATTRRSFVERNGVRKRSKRFRLTQPKMKRARAPLKSAVEKSLREEVSSRHFPLSDLEWSGWTRAIQRRSPDANHWESRLGAHVGARRKQLFDDMSRPAVYEVAVGVPDHRHKVPVLATVRQGVQGQSWEAALLSKDKLRRQVDRVLKRGCDVYVRKAPFSVHHMRSVYDRCHLRRKPGCAKTTKDAVHELRGLMARVCDYAWKDHYDIPSRTYSHRRLVVNGVTVSD